MIRWRLRPISDDLVLSLKPHGFPAALVAAVAGALIVLLSLVPGSLVLPLLSVLFIGLSGLVALAAWWTGCKWFSAGITPWDVSGAFALIGCAAAILGEPENVLHLFGSPTVTQ